MKDLITHFIKKYLFTFLSIIILGIVVLIMIDNIDDSKETVVIALVNITSFLMAIITGSFMIDKIYDCYSEKISIKIPEKIQNNTYLINLIYCLMALIIFSILRLIPNPNTNEKTNFIYFYYHSIFLVVAYYFICKKKNMSIYEYSTKIFINSLILVLFETVLTIGMSILIYIYYVLFKDVDFKIFAKIIVFLLIVITYIGILVTMEKVDGKLKLFAKVLIKYVMLIMALIGFMFFYIYLFKMIKNWEIPSNQVFGVCAVLFVGGVYTALMARSFDENTMYDKVIEYIPVVFIPAMILQIFSLGLRIGQYGLTMTRYYGIMLVIFEIAYTIIYIFKNEKLRIIVLIEAIILFVMHFMPMLNVYQFPEIFNKFS